MQKPLTTELRDQLQSSLGGHYTIERELGGGGMARVFVAEDRQLRRKVVIKMLPSEMASTISVERFALEIQLLARLQHPHIVPLLAAGDADGVPYYTMPLVQGESLRHRLTTHGKVPVAEAVRLAGEVADALAYAHGEGVIHRDIKPENILFSGGHALVVDFGIAKALDAAKTRDGASITTAGMLVGTPAYISPEQAAGEEIDARCDLYSLGAVLYEMVSGKPPFTGATTVAVLAKRFSENPPGLRTMDSAVPANLERTVERAMAREPANRYATAGDLMQALRAALDPGAQQPSATASAKTEKSIAVLPFANMSGDPDSEYFSDGITEEIINALAHLSGVRVAARTSSFAFKGKTADIREIGSKLGVTTVLEGSVRRAGKRIRITAQLINVTDGYHLWSERYDRDLEDVFAIQDEIARAIAHQLEAALRGDDATRMARPGTANLEAYDLYLRGRSFWQRRGRHVETARGFFERAVAIDPNFASAHAGLADCDSVMVAYGYNTKAEVGERARYHAYRAIELNDRLAEAHVAVGLFEGWVNSRHEAGDAAFARAAELTPVWGLPLAYRAFLATIIGRPQTAPAFARAAQQTEPLSPLVHAVAGMGLTFARYYDAGWDAAQRALEIDDRMTIAQLVVGWVHHHRQEWTAGSEALRRAVGDGRSPIALASLGLLLAKAGQREEPLEIARELEQRNRPEYAGVVRLALGQVREALELYEASVPATSAFVTLLLPGLDTFIHDERFLGILRRAGYNVVARALENLEG